jgi:adenylate kinase family enzyme
MNKIFHIIGTSCSGKTYLVERLKEKFPEHCASWDILEDFYNKHQVFVNGKMDWSKFNQSMKVVALELSNFIEENQDKIIFIETSGTNKTINLLIPDLEKRYGEIAVIALKTPDEDTLVERATARNLDVNSTIGFAMNFSNSVWNVRFLSVEQAQKELETKIIELLTND